MYKPVPQTQTNNDGEESESELFNSSFNCDEKSLENEGLSNLILANCLAY